LEGIILSELDNSRRGKRAITTRNLLPKKACLRFFFDKSGRQDVSIIRPILKSATFLSLGTIGVAIRTWKGPYEASPF
jgi:hypothetical protein